MVLFHLVSMTVHLYSLSLYCWLPLPIAYLTLPIVQCPLSIGQCPLLFHNAHCYLTLPSPIAYCTLSIGQCPLVGWEWPTCFLAVYSERCSLKAAFVSVHCKTLKDFDLNSHEFFQIIQNLHTKKHISVSSRKLGFCGNYSWLYLKDYLAWIWLQKDILPAAHCVFECIKFYFNNMRTISIVFWSVSIIPK